MFRHAGWHIGFGYVIGVIGVVFGVALATAGLVSPWWLLAWFFIHHFNTAIVSGGLHRYFTHGAFKTSRFWHNFIAFYSTTLLYGSPYVWASAHTTHHIHADTDLDPHEVNWKYLIFKQFRRVPMVMERVKKIAGDPTLDFIHRYWFALWGVYAGALLFVSPTVFLFAYLMPMGTAQAFGVIHQLLSHRRQGGARNLPWLEFLFPTGGEWQHKTHHDYPGQADFRTHWWHLDVGAVFIRLIRTDSPSRHFQ